MGLDKEGKHVIFFFKELEQITILGIAKRNQPTKDVSLARSMGMLKAPNKKVESLTMQRDTFVLYISIACSMPTLLLPNQRLKIPSPCLLGLWLKVTNDLGKEPNLPDN